LAQDLRRVLGPATGQVLDLLAAGNAGRDDLGLRGRGLHGRGEATITERDRDVVVLALEAERARHTAAARVDLLDLEARPAERPDRRRRADQRLLVAVPVEQSLLAVAPERERESLGALAHQEFLEEERLRGDRPRVVCAYEVDRLVAEGQETRGLETDDGHAAPRVRRQSRHVPLRVLARLAEHPLGDERPAAALAVHQDDAITARLAYFH